MFRATKVSQFQLFIEMLIETFIELFVEQILVGIRAENGITHKRDTHILAQSTIERSAV